MAETNLRLIEKGNPPTPELIESWLGKKAFSYWEKISEFIEENYPGVFEPDWLFGGQIHGWSLRYKKSKSFCTLIPEKKRCMILIVFGGVEREKVEEIKKELSEETQRNYDEAKTYHDGKWVLLNINETKILSDVKLLFKIKRKPKI